MLYGRIADGRLKVAPNSLIGKTESEMKSLGYYPVEEQIRPMLDDGCCAVSKYVLDGATIRQEWSVHPDTSPLSVDDVLRLTIRKTVNSLDIPDATASRMVDYYPELTGDGSLIKAGTKINWHGVLKRAAVDLWDTTENNPDNAPALWVDIAYREGIRIIPETITAAQAFALDELGWWKEHVYRSTITANVYTPDQYAAGWELLT